MKIYCIIDKKASACIGIFQSPSNETAVRSFLNLIETPEDTVYNSNPQDFALYYMGEIVVKNSPLIIAPGFEYAVQDADRYRLAPKLDAAEEIFDGSSLARQLIDSKRIQKAELRVSMTLPLELREKFLDFIKENKDESGKDN